MKSSTIGILTLLLSILPGNVLLGFLEAVPVTNFADHPVIDSVAPVTQHQWRRSVGDFGETMAAENFRLRGFQDVVEVKAGGGQGIDLVAIRRGPGGEIAEVRIVEVKTHYSARSARMSQTRHGRQMSRDWLARKFREMHRSPDSSTRELAREISRFRREQGIPVERLGEIHEVNLRNRTYTVRGTDGSIRSDRSLGPYLREIEQRTSSPGTRNWARTHRERLPAITEARMPQRTSMEGRATAAVENPGRTGNAAISTEKARPKILLRAAGPLGAFAAAAADAHELYGHWSDYEQGRMTRDEFRRRIARSGGGIAGAGAAATGGAYTGAKMGAPFGPKGVVIGAVIGGGVAGVAGYFGGSAAAGALADTWIGRMDKDVKEGLDQWLVQLDFGL